MTEMNEKVDEANVPREPWQRLLEEDGDGPPETTDARIRANARRDLAPRGQRWWLPASLAASFVLAVLIVRSEIGTGRLMPIAADAPGGNEAMDARIIERQEGEQAREPGQAPSAASQRAEKQREVAESDEYGYQDSELGSEAAGDGSARRRAGARTKVGERESRGTRGTRDCRTCGRPAEFRGRAATRRRPPRTPPRRRLRQRCKGRQETRRSRRDRYAPAHIRTVDADHVFVVDPAARRGSRGRLESRDTGGDVALPKPEAWYAAIERLRRDGQHRGGGPRARAPEESLPGLARGTRQAAGETLNRAHSARRRFLPSLSSRRWAASSFGYSGSTRSSVSTRIFATAARM